MKKIIGTVAALLLATNVFAQPQPGMQQCIAPPTRIQTGLGDKFNEAIMMAEDYVSVSGYPVREELWYNMNTGSYTLLRIVPIPGQEDMKKTCAAVVSQGKLSPYRGVEG